MLPGQELLCLPPPHRASDEGGGNNTAAGLLCPCLARVLSLRHAPTGQYTPVLWLHRSCYTPGPRSQSWPLLVASWVSLTGRPFEGPSNSPELSLLSFCPPPSPAWPPDEWGQHPAHPAQSPRAIFVILFSEVCVCRQVRSIGQFRLSEVTTGHPSSPHGLVQALSAPH